MENLSEKEDRMHGSIFVFLRRFVETNFDHSTWLQLLEASGIAHETYQMHEFYPTREIYDIVNTASRVTGISAFDLEEKFGEFLVPDLLMIYKKYINPTWKTFEMILYTESTMHSAVRTEDNRTSPPILNITKVNDKLLIIDYFSKRRMAPVAVGIIKGIAAYYEESDKVTVIPVTPYDSERVQIKVQFA